MYNIKLRPFDYRLDLQCLFAYMLEEGNQKMFSHGFQIHNIPQFEQWITEKFAKNEFHDFFMIECDDEYTIGFTFSYDFFNYDGHCKYTLCLYEDWQNKGYGAVVALKMMDYLFKKYPLKQILISVFDYNANSLSSNLKGGFEEVGVIPEYRFCDGEYHAMHILRITREKFYETNKKRLNMIKEKEN